MCLVVGTFTLSMGAHGGQKGAGYDRLWAAWECRELNSGPLKEQCMFLTAELHLQLGLLAFWKYTAYHWFDQSHAVPQHNSGLTHLSPVPLLYTPSLLTWFYSWCLWHHLFYIPHMSEIMWNLSLSAWHISFIKTGFRESGTKHHLSHYRWELHAVVNDRNFIVYLTFQIHQYNNVLLKGKHGAKVVK